MYSIEFAVPSDLEFIAAHMDPADAAEVWAASHKTPSEALEASSRVSRETYVGLAYGLPVCAFGVGQRTLMDTAGVPWLLGTPEVRNHAKAFARRSKDWIDREMLHYTRLENWVDARHTRAVRWLRWLGFTLDAPAPYGLDGMPFHRFYREV